MQLTTYLSVAAAVATVSARNAVDLTKNCNFSKPHIRIINRCSYPVNLWSVLKTDGCPDYGMVTLKKGEVYSENLISAMDTPSKDTGVSIKISKTDKCKGNDIAQAEYFMDNRPSSGKYKNNYYDMSYVDCPEDCPTRQDGYFWSAGTAAVKASRVAADNTWCPNLSCYDFASCSAISYTFPDDIKTMTCTLESSMDLYLCGSQPPSEDDEKPESKPEPKPEKPEYKPEPKPEPTPEPKPKPSTTLEPVVSSAVNNYKANIAAVTSAPEIDEAIEAPPKVKVKTEIVYVTAIEYVNAKRHEHAHAHARRHQQFHA